MAGYTAAAELRAELLERAARLVPVLREGAAETERRRQPLPENITALKEAQLIRATQPTRFGGLGLDFDLAPEVCAELGRGCGSTAWCYGIWASHNWLIGLFPEKAQEEYWPSRRIPSLPPPSTRPGDKWPSLPEAIGFPASGIFPAAAMRRPGLC